MICDHQSEDWKAHLKETHNYFGEETINRGKMRGGKEAEKRLKKHEQLMKINQQIREERDREETETKLATS